eukprot:8361151-Pyramimonas_sp.AAC.1
MPLLGKPCTCNILIVLYSNSYRVWQRARRSLVQFMRGALDRKSRGASEGRRVMRIALLLRLLEQRAT